MDPEANLEEQREIRARIKAKRTLPGDYGRLKELSAALNGWIRRGGYDPRKPRRSNPRRPARRRNARKEGTRFVVVPGLSNGGMLHVNTAHEREVAKANMRVFGIRSLPVFFLPYGSSQAEATRATLKATASNPRRPAKRARKANPKRRTRRNARKCACRSNPHGKCACRSNPRRRARNARRPVRRTNSRRTSRR